MADRSVQRFRARRFTVRQPVVATATIAQGEVQETIGPEGDGAGIVVELGLVDRKSFPSYFALGEIGPIQILRDQRLLDRLSIG